MVKSLLVTFGVIFVVIFLWAIIDRWHKKSWRNSAGTAQQECDLPRVECGHCLMTDICDLKEEGSDNRGQKNG